MYIVYIRSLRMYVLWFWNTRPSGFSECSSQRSQDLKHIRMAAVIKRVCFWKHTQHTLKKKKSVIFIANVSSTIIFFFVIILKGGKQVENANLFYFILAQHLQIIFLNWCASSFFYFFPLFLDIHHHHTFSLFPSPVNFHLKQNSVFIHIWNIQIGVCAHGQLFSKATTTSFFSCTVPTKNTTFLCSGLKFALLLLLLLLFLPSTVYYQLYRLKCYHLSRNNTHISGNPSGFDHNVSATTGVWGALWKKLLICANVIWDLRWQKWSGYKFCLFVAFT